MLSSKQDTKTMILIYSNDSLPKSLKSAGQPLVDEIRVCIVSKFFSLAVAD